MGAPEKKTVKKNEEKNYSSKGKKTRQGKRAGKRKKAQPPLQSTKTWVPKTKFIYSKIAGMPDASAIYLVRIERLHSLKRAQTRLCRGRS